MVRQSPWWTIRLITPTAFSIPVTGVAPFSYQAKSDLLPNLLGEISAYWWSSTSWTAVYGRRWGPQNGGDDIPVKEFFKWHDDDNPKCSCGPQSATVSVSLPSDARQKGSQTGLRRACPVARVGMGLRILGSDRRRLVCARLYHVSEEATFPR
ncbi:hypothetical protein ASPFODRAFT_29343 [Aspergillus luchuensis CBS 106.47]|uniref:Uncharacterized protein n=1 Tax=Aspergillus luchuensis (strain CBS 106.47) TaxID=1137211 RepID=A0A1M3TVY4_ASPLC|nr:hypothetical protein ASPFODRAFT_29343 [Aspergillus luchuensis CBS 106.47]